MIWLPVLHHPQPHPKPPYLSPLPPHHHHPQVPQERAQALADALAACARDCQGVVPDHRATIRAALAAIGADTKVRPRAMPCPGPLHCGVSLLADGSC